MPSRRRPSLSLVISLLALVVATGGTSYAAAKIHGNQIKSGTVTNKALKSQTIRGTKVRPDTLTGTQVKEATLAKVPSAATADAAAPSGPAGGALTGTYPDPQVADDAIGSTELGTITARSSGLINVGANLVGSATAECLPGEQVMGGGNDGSLSLRVVASRSQGQLGWRVFAFNDSGSNASLQAHVYCLAP